MDLEEALAQADTYSVDEEICTIDNDLRTITIPSGLQTVGVESDEDVRRLNFQMPKQYGEFDLSEFEIKINYLNANNQGDVYEVTDNAVSGDNITFSWLIGRYALAYKGNIKFVVCLKKMDAESVVQQEFNTTVAQLTVLEGLETTEAVVAENPDIIEQILARLDELEENGGGGGTPGKDGVGISNIAKTGTAGLVDTYTITMTDETSYTFTVKNGENGNPGQDGTTPTIGENGNWYLGETDTGKPSRGETPNIKIGTVQTLDPGNQATASVTGTIENPLLNLGIPRGQDGTGGGSGNTDIKKYFKKITLEEEVGYAFVPFSEFKGCNRLFVQLYIPIIEEESYTNYVPRIKAANSSSWSNSGFVISTYTVSTNSNMLIMHGEIIIKEYDAYFVSGGKRLQYTPETTNGVNGTSLGQVFAFQDSEESGIYVELYSRTTYSFPIGTEIILVGI